MRKKTPVHSYTYRTELGPITITEEEGFITECLFGDFGYFDANTDLTDEAYRQIEEYLHGERKTFDLPLKQEGSDFDQEVWRILESIPIGKRITYAQIANQLGRPTAARAVGNACGRNRIAIIIPCHRAIRSDGTVGGYAWGPERKNNLLKVEERFWAEKE